MQENVEKSIADRHAYMIRAHGNLAGLEKLLSVLDDAHNDIYEEKAEMRRKLEDTFGYV